MTQEREAQLLAYLEALRAVVQRLAAHRGSVDRNLARELEQLEAAAAEVRAGGPSREV